jgi:hypothetical protein
VVSAYLLLAADLHKHTSYSFVSETWDFNTIIIIIIIIISSSSSSSCSSISISIWPNTKICYILYPLEVKLVNLWLQILRVIIKR